MNTTRLLGITLALFGSTAHRAIAEDGSIPTSSVNLSGGWSGSWSSSSTGHRGPLQANFTRRDDGTVRAQFRGRFFVVVPFRYAVNLQVVEEQPDHLTLSGSSRLGPIMGTFSYSATVTNHDFIADYHSRNDSGQFRLRRVR
jgi:hypothetical protein